MTCPQRHPQRKILETTLTELFAGDVSKIRSPFLVLPQPAVRKVRHRSESLQEKDLETHHFYIDRPTAFFAVLILYPDVLSRFS